jgi:hypothetical protein
VNGVPNEKLRAEAEKLNGNIRRKYMDYVYGGDILNAMLAVEQGWCVIDVLSEGLIILSGKPKIGKSGIIRQLAQSVATGKPWLGKFDTVKGDVLYIALEDTPESIKIKWCLMTGGKIARRPLGNGRFEVTCVGGLPIPSNLHFAHSWPKAGEGGHREIDNWCEDHPNARLVIIDTLKKIRSPKEGGTRPVKAAVGCDRQAAAATRDCCAARQFQGRSSWMRLAG